eukprot:TRINITY_DN2369_c0_g1_i7.p1 TRINITY_DN2369_c0_g1~~TRINITY_DN2369_c0_g1_i7.p1  ORF type:complete len:278 (+),score=55.60 TRINITY_DN2369_c0_g1_i7:422-1255(+)
MGWIELVYHIANPTGAKFVTNLRRYTLGWVCITSLLVYMASMISIHFLWHGSFIEGLNTPITILLSYWIMHCLPLAFALAFYGWRFRKLVQRIQNVHSSKFDDYISRLMKLNIMIVVSVVLFSIFSFKYVFSGFPSLRSSGVDLAFALPPIVFTPFFILWFFNPWTTFRERARKDSSSGSGSGLSPHNSSNSGGAGGGGSSGAPPGGNNNSVQNSSVAVAIASCEVVDMNEVVESLNRTMSVDITIHSSTTSSSSSSSSSPPSIELRVDAPEPDIQT